MASQLSERPIVLYTDFNNQVAPSEVRASIQSARVREKKSLATILTEVHDVYPLSIHDGAFHSRQLARAWQPFDPVYLGVIDPGVGTSREPIALETERGGIFVGPNNGIFHLAAEELGVKNAVVLDEGIRLLSRDKSTTFDGRDLFAPAAALLSAGENISALGKELPAELLKDPEFKSGDILHMCGLDNAKIHNFEEVYERVRLALEFCIQGHHRSRLARKVRTFGDAQTGELILYPGSSQMIEMAKVNSSIKDELQIKPGDRIIPLGEHPIA